MIILYLLQFIAVLILGIMTLMGKEVSKTDFACCWIILLIELFLNLPNKVV